VPYLDQDHLYRYHKLFHNSKRTIKLQNDDEVTFISQGLSDLLKTPKWSLPLQELFEWIDKNVGDDEDEITVDDVKNALPKATEHLRQKSTDWLELFKKPAILSYGHLVLGRRGFSTRFKWNEPPRPLAKKVISISADGNKTPEQANIANNLMSMDALLEYVFPLRHGITASIRVPSDITGEELGRLADFIRLLPGYNGAFS
jgi:hypothetical protein